MLSAQPTPSLPLELAERLLATATRSLPLRPGRRGPLAFSNAASDPCTTNALHTLLSVLGPRGHFREMTWTALDRCWWVDHDFASANGDLDLLELMDCMSQGLGGAPKRPLQWTHIAMDQASKQGFVNVLDWWYERFGAACWYTEEALTGAAEAGHLDTLKWWTDRKDALACELNNKILLHATLGGHKEICEWWLNTHFDKSRPILNSAHGFPAVGVLVHALMHAVLTNDSDFDMFDWWVAHPYCTQSMLQADAYVNGHALALRDFLWDHRSSAIRIINCILPKMGEANLLVILNASVATCAAISTDPDTITWLEKHLSPLLLQSLVSIIYVEASAAGNVPVLDWLCGFGTPKFNASKIASDSLKRASETGQVHILDWWIEACLWFGRVRSHFTESADAGTEAVLGAAAGGHLDVLDWWKTKSQLLFTYQEPALKAAAKGGHVAVLELLVRSGNRVIWSPEVIRAACQANRVTVLDWWMRQQAQGKLSIGKTGITNAIMAASASSNIDVLDWWFRTGWFVHVHEHKSSLFPGQPSPKLQVLHWWMRYLSNGDQFDKALRIHSSLLFSLAFSASALLFGKYMLWYGAHQPAPQPPTALFAVIDAYKNALHSGSICMLEWCMGSSGIRRTQPLLEDEFAKQQACRHVKAWLFMNVE